jgi:hypothetical protein
VTEPKPTPTPSSSASASTRTSSNSSASTAEQKPLDGKSVEQVHDFARKLQQPSLWPKVVDYVEWQRAQRAAKAAGKPAPDLPDLSPLSINLDLTTACNYACDHCIDWDILNSKVRHEDQELRDSLQRMAERGLKSVILIGGGEPTLYPGFAGIVEFLKQLGLSVSVVSNGSRGDRLLAAAPFFTEGDWIRLVARLGQQRGVPPHAQPVEQDADARRDLQLDAEDQGRQSGAAARLLVRHHVEGRQPRRREDHREHPGDGDGEQARQRRDVRLHLVQAVPRAAAGRRRGHGPGEDRGRTAGRRRAHPGEPRRGAQPSCGRASACWRAPTCAC